MNVTNLVGAGGPGWAASEQKINKSWFINQQTINI